MISCPTDFYLPIVRDVYWSTTADGTSRAVTVQDNTPIWIVIETEYLPGGCQAEIQIRDLEHANAVRSRATVNLPVGTGRTIHRWHTPDINWVIDLFGHDDQYHCRVCVTKPGTNLEIIWGSQQLLVE